MLRLDILKELLPSKIWTVLQAIVRIVSLIFFLCMFVNSLDLLASMQKTSRVSAALGIPYTFIYLSTVLGFGPCGYPWSPDDCGTGDRVF